MPAIGDASTVPGFGQFPIAGIIVAPFVGLTTGIPLRWRSAWLSAQT